MTRSILSACALAAMLFGSTAVPSSAHAQSGGAPLELNQTLLDRWLIAVPAINKLATSSAVPQSDEAARPHLERICTDAGFDTPDQCKITIAYVGMLVGGFDPRTKTFRDPIERMRAQVAQIEGNTQLSAATKDQMAAPLKEVIGGFPHRIPEAHLQLMTANGERIFKTIRTERKP